MSRVDPQRQNRSGEDNQPWAGVRTVPSSHYTDPEHLRREEDEVFKRAWIVVAREEQIPRPGDYVVFDELGESLVAVRDESGRVRVLHNSCRHRGSRMLEGCGHADTLDCPYHGWSYGLDGSLKGVPRIGGFDALDTNRMGLHAVRSSTWLGFVWINLDPDAPPLLATLGSLPDELAPYRLEEMRPIAIKDEVVPANWKAMLENAMDFYHVPFVHGRTINKHVTRGPDLQSYGDHTRQRLPIAAYGWRASLDRRCTRGGPYTPLQVSALHKYLVFPNFLINVLPFHLTVMQVFPIDTHSCRLRYAFCKRQGARGIELARVYGTWASSRYILWEDLTVLDRFQRGVDTQRVSTQTLHDEEAAASHFHGVLRRWMESPPTP